MNRLIVVVFSMAFLLLAAQSASAIQFFQADLTASQEVPPNASQATGRMVLVFDDASATMHYRLSVSGLTGINGGHVHEAPAGSNGNVIFPLDVTTLSNTNPISGTFTVTPAQLSTFQTSGFYVNVHTTANPGGEIRGQITSFTPSAFTAILTGDQEVPPVTTSATGVGRFTLANNTLSYNVTVANISNITAAHIHLGRAGVAGGVVFDLFPTPGSPTFNTTTPVTGNLTLTPANIVDLLTDVYYVNVHTQANGGGEIRGQIMKAAAITFRATLTGAQEVPPVTTNATGTMTLVLNAAMNTMFYKLEVFNISNVNGQHIHEGAPGVSGGVIFPLNGTLAAGTPLTGNFAVTPAQVDSFVANAYYANVHTDQNPGGEIRGQIGRFVPQLRWSALLTGAQEVPPVTTSASGVARFQLRNNTDLQYTLMVKSLSSTVTGAHIHRGAAGVNGAVLVTLYDGTGTLTESIPFTGIRTIADTDLLDFLTGGTYVNVHTTNNPNGEVRGQLHATVAGDQNGDSVTTVTDIFYLINFLFSNGALPDSGDANADGVTTVTDVFYLVNFLFTNGPPPL